MELGLKDVLYIIGLVASVIITFLTTKHKLKEYVRDKNDELKKEINQLRIEIEVQKAIVNHMNNYYKDTIKNIEELIKKL